MKVLILAAGYGTRLESDVKADATGKYKHLSGKPKPLVPVGGRPLVSHWLEHLAELKLTGDALYIVTNQHNHSQFEAWAAASAVPFSASHLICDGSTSNATRLGAIADIALVIERAGIDDDLLIIGGDTLFFDDFSLPQLFADFQSRKDGASAVLWYETVDTTRTGILVTNGDGIVTGFLEKPKPDATTSRKACPCFYLYRRTVLPLIRQYVAQAKTLPELDATGTLVPWLLSRAPLYAYRISGRFDIGGLDTYIEADDFFTRKAAAKAAALVKAPGAAAAAGASSAAAAGASSAAAAPTAASAAVAAAVAPASATASAELKVANGHAAAAADAHAPAANGHAIANGK